MKKFKNILLIFFTVLILAAIAIAITLNNYNQKALPDYNKNLVYSKLKSEVTILRDSLAIPHIYADNEEDLYFATGYIMAQDRLWQMDLLRRVTTGKLSQIFGKSYSDTDVLMRSLRIQEKSKIVLQKSSPEINKALNAFSKGVNYYIKENKDELPLEFNILKYKPEPWKPVHSINLIGYMAWDLTMPWSYEITTHKIKQKVSKRYFKSIVPDVAKQKDVIFPEFKMKDEEKRVIAKLESATSKLNNLGINIFTGSNNWVISGEKSKTGKPILANDMHLGLFSPGIWYQIHQVSSSGLDVTGVILPGQPFVICGHNQSVAWGMTNVMLDDMDFYRETINKKDSSKYLLDGNWKNLNIEKEAIPLKNGDTLIKEIKYTHRGPIISKQKNLKDPVSMRWIGNEYSNELRSVYRLNHAKNWNDFKEAMKTFKSISQNIAYADTNGNIGLYCCAGIPIRKGKGIFIYPGDTTRYDWEGLVPFEKLPHVYNPESGFAASANNKTVSKGYPYYISKWFDLPSRYNRIKKYINSREKLSVKDMQKLQTDQHSIMAEHYAPIFIQHIAKMEKELNTHEKKLLESFKKWNYEYKTDLTAPLIFEQMYINLVKNIAKDELGDTLFREFMGRRIIVRNFIRKIFNSEGNPWIDDVTTQKKEMLSDIIFKSYRKTVEEIAEMADENLSQISWGDQHTISFKHPLSQKKILDRAFNLNRGPFKVGGSYHTVRPYSYSYNNPYNANHGASQRHIYNTANWDESFSVIPTGNSGIPASNFYCNQTQLYINDRYHRDLFTLPEIEKEHKYKMKITKN